MPAPCSAGSACLTVQHWRFLFAARSSTRSTVFKPAACTDADVSSGSELHLPVRGAGEQSASLNVAHQACKHLAMAASDARFINQQSRAASGQRRSTLQGAHCVEGGEAQAWCAKVLAKNIVANKKARAKFPLVTTRVAGRVESTCPMGMTMHHIMSASDLYHGAVLRHMFPSFPGSVCSRALTAGVRPRCPC